MESCFSSGNFFRLIDANHDDPDSSDMIFECAQSFEAYHNAVFKMEMKAKIFRNAGMETDAYQDMVMELDRARTRCHNALLANVSILNRMAEKSNIGTIYSGVIDKEQPYRREVADAVLKFVEEVVVMRT